MKGKDSDWWESEDDEWEWVGAPVEEEDKKRGPKLRTFSVQFKDDVIRSVEIDASSERDAISQVLEEYVESDNLKDITIISVIEVDDEY